jgi:hypothetical protein
MQELDKINKTPVPGVKFVPNESNPFEWMLYVDGPVSNMSCAPSASNIDAAQLCHALVAYAGATGHMCNETLKHSQAATDNQLQPSLQLPL